MMGLAIADDFFRALMVKDIFAYATATARFLILLQE